MEVMRLWHKLAQDERLLKVMLGVIALQLLLIVVLAATLIKKQNDITIHIPPNLENGASITNGEVPAANIYAFSYYVWQVLNHWPEDGNTDFDNNINAYRFYLTPEFTKQLQRQFQASKVKGEVQQRQRVLQQITLATMSANDVIKINNDKWQVNLKVNLQEYSNGIKVKDVNMVFPLKVIKWNINRNLNPWGLALAGFAQEPYRISDNN